MLAARLGAWLRNTGEKWARTSFAEKLALLLALLAVIYTVVTGAAELRYQARAREALAQVKAARLAAGRGQRIEAVFRGEVDDPVLREKGLGNLAAGRTSGGGKQNLLGCSIRRYAQDGIRSIAAVGEQIEIPAVRTEHP